LGTFGFRETAKQSFYNMVFKFCCRLFAGFHLVYSIVMMAYYTGILANPKSEILAYLDVQPGMMIISRRF
jgi:hypothetical protein